MWQRAVMGLLFEELSPRTVNFPVFPRSTADLPKWCGRTGLHSEYRPLPKASWPSSTDESRGVWSGCSWAPTFSTRSEGPVVPASGMAAWRWWSCGRTLGRFGAGKIG
jgi:hypothetical protein